MTNCTMLKLRIFYTINIPLAMKRQATEWEKDIATYMTYT